MIYTTVTIGGNEYKLRLAASKMIEVEKALGKNPINVILEMHNGDGMPTIPKMGDLLTIFWGALTYYQHSITKDNACALYDQYIEGGGSIESFVSDVIMPAFKSAGYLADEPDETGDTEKNE